MLGGTGYPVVTIYDGVAISERYSFTERDGVFIKIAFDEELDGDLIELDNGGRQKYRKGWRFKAWITFLFDDGNPNKSTDSGGSPLNSCQVFLKNLCNTSLTIKVKPHSDKTQEYEVFLMNGWQFAHAFDRHKGYHGTLVFEGTEILSSIDLAA